MNEGLFDLHCHIIPGVDDGARDIQTAHQMLKAASDIGITHIVATPHVLRPDADLAFIAKQMDSIRPLASECGITLTQGYECNIKALRVDDLAAAERFCIEGTRALLLEFPQISIWQTSWLDLIYLLQAKGLIIIIAHPERYDYAVSAERVMDDLRELKCFLQISATSLGLSNMHKKIIKSFASLGFIDFFASDAHYPSDYQYFANKHGKYRANSTFDDLLSTPYTSKQP